MIGRRAVAAQQGEIFNIGGGFRLLTINAVGEPDIADRLAWHAVAQYELLSGGGAAVAFLVRKLAHPGIRQPRSAGVRFFTFAALGRSEIPVCQALPENGFSHFFMQREPLRLPVLLIPSQI